MSRDLPGRGGMSICQGETGEALGGTELVELKNKDGAAWLSSSGSHAIACIFWRAHSNPNCLSPPPEFLIWYV